MINDCFSFKAVTTEGEQYLGMSMTYSLFEYAKENFDKLLEDQPEQIFETKVSDGLAKLEIQEGEIYLYFSSQIQLVQWNRITLGKHKMITIPCVI